MSTRRENLNQMIGGLGVLAFNTFYANANVNAATSKPQMGPPSFNLYPKQPHFKPKATAMISLFMDGGPSHIDLHDPKPMLEKFDGKKYPIGKDEIVFDNPSRSSLTLHASVAKFKKYGQSGTEVSDLVPHLGSIVDDIALVRSMQSDVNNHGQAISALNTGSLLRGSPTLGSWLAFALGSVSEDLPACVHLKSPGKLPFAGTSMWSNGFLPSIYQGTAVRAAEPRILNLDAPPHLAGKAQAEYLHFLDALNKTNLKDYIYETELQARMQSFELAEKMQTSAKEAFDISQESKSTIELYGIDKEETKDYGTRCLIARRLVERGVRYIQIHNTYSIWDHHQNITVKLSRETKMTDQPSAALVKDLKNLGLLDTTLVHWGGEMGRLPVAEKATQGKWGRDHNTFGFSMWLAGGGIKSGITYGNTDEFGHHAIENIVKPHDFHATVLALFGLDHKKLIYKGSGQSGTLVTEGSARVIHDIIS